MRKSFLILVFVALVTSVMGQGKAKYVFYFIGDGMGVNQVNVTEMFRAAAEEDRIGTLPLEFTKLPVMGVANTYCTSSPVTDSAAAGTALSTGEKTYSGAIGVNPDKQPIETVAERARKAGVKVGVATSVSIDHATPAAFFAHQPSRGMSYEIACDLPVSGFDFFAGGGFVRTDRNAKNEPATNIFTLFEEAGYTVARGMDAFNATAATAKKMVLIQPEDRDQGGIPYAIDRRPGDLTLKEITESGISFLTKNNKKGFFLMIEGGRIDWACHDNDGATMIREVEDMDAAIQVALDFYRKHPRETLIVITADHETGGITLGKSGYHANLKVLKHQKQSQGGLSDRIKELRKQKGKKTTWDDMRKLLGETMGFWTEIPMSWEHERRLRDAFENSFNEKTHVEMEKNMYSSSEPLAGTAVRVMNDIAYLGWSSHDHSAGYVPVYAIGAGSNLFGGTMNNTDIPKKIMKAARY